MVVTEDQTQENRSIIALEKMEDVIKKVFKEMLNTNMKSIRSTQ